MRSETSDGARVADALEALRQELARLGERVAALEAAVGTKPAAAALAPSRESARPLASAERAPQSEPAGPAQAEGLSEELLLVLSAASAAYLGKKPHIRQIRLLGSAAWAQQGRVTIQ